MLLEVLKAHWCIHTDTPDHREPTWRWTPETRRTWTQTQYWRKWPKPLEPISISTNKIKHLKIHRQDPWWGDIWKCTDIFFVSLTFVQSQATSQVGEKKPNLNARLIYFALSMVPTLTSPELAERGHFRKKTSVRWTQGMCKLLIADSVVKPVCLFVPACQHPLSHGAGFRVSQSQRRGGNSTHQQGRLLGPSAGFTSCLFLRFHVSVV